MGELFEAILSLKTRQEVEAFFRDVCTLGELELMAQRWQVAQLLSLEALPYTEIARRTGATTTTLTRVPHWLRHGEGGYEVALARTPAARR